MAYDLLLITQIKEREKLKEVERLKKQLDDMKDNERIEREEKQLRERYKKEIVEEQNKLEKANLEKKHKQQMTSEGPTKEELARMKLEEELAKKAKKQQEQQAKLDMLYEKMTEGPRFDQRVASPPIPALRNRNSIGTGIGPPKSPPIPALQKRQASEHTEAASSMHLPPNTSTPVTQTQSIPSVVSQPLSVPAVIPQSVSAASHQPYVIPNQVSLEQTSVNSVPLQPSTENYPPLRLPPPPPHRSSSPVQILPVTQPQAAVRSNESARLLRGLSNLKQQIRQRATSMAAPAEGNQTSTSAQQASSQRPAIAFPQRLKGARREPQATSAVDPPPASSALDEFNRLKYNQPTESRVGLWQQYPQPPRTNTALEIQQDAMLRHQQQMLDRARARERNTETSE